MNIGQEILQYMVNLEVGLISVERGSTIWFFLVNEIFYELNDNKKIEIGRGLI